ncbi:DUF4829 domain-containing protein [Clostridium baratii]|uniref:DUF4829 domain-containing protein n=1 Tax=Clostridium baratii TaxID=1561 RepID=UPI00097FBCC8|nr:DUF4829 domain-containing protein [Clostridium baratii]AQM59413.1 hypothetical protein NPD11_47 [Clostridium baratii]
MKSKKCKFISLCTAILLIVLCAIWKFNFNDTKATTLKEEAKKNSIALMKKYLKTYNDSVTDDLKTKSEEDETLRKAVYDDIESFEVLEIKELENPDLNFNGKTYDKENIAKFEVTYKVVFKENITSSEEGKVSTTKIITRESKSAPWLVAGQSGHGL